jgi:hypothetical protein
VYGSSSFSFSLIALSDSHSCNSCLSSILTIEFGIDRRRAPNWCLIRWCLVVLRACKCLQHVAW